MIKKIIQEAFVLKQNGYYKHAIEAFYKALELDNTSLELLLEIADSYYLMSDEEHALNYLEQILEKDPAHIDSLKLLKKIFIKKQAWTQAEQTAKNIYCISKDINDLVDIFEFLNKQNRGEEIFEYEIEKFNHKIYYEMAYAKLQVRDFIKAEEFINKALELEVNNKNLLLKGTILFKQNKEEDCYQIVEDFDENTLEAAQNNFIGLILQYKGEYKKAIKHFLESIKQNPKVDEYYYNCASTYFKMGDNAQAKNYYNLAINLNPENQNYHFALANLYYSEKQYRRAMEELDYDFFEANLLKSIILYETGYVALAKKSLEKITNERPENLVIQEYMRKIEEALKI